MCLCRASASNDNSRCNVFSLSLTQREICIVDEANEHKWSVKSLRCLRVACFKESLDCNFDGVEQHCAKYCNLRVQTKTSTHKKTRCKNNNNNFLFDINSFLIFLLLFFFITRRCRARSNGSRAKIENNEIIRIEFLFFLQLVVVVFFHDTQWLCLTFLATCQLWRAANRLATSVTTVVKKQINTNNKDYVVRTNESY